MFSQESILIAEDNCYQALDLSLAIEGMNGKVIGPAASVDEAVKLIKDGSVAGAILDCELDGRDCRPVAELLIKRRLPFVVHTASPSPSVIHALPPDIPVLIKPQPPEAVLHRLFEEFRRLILA